MTPSKPTTFGQYLLDTARVNGITADEIAELLQMTIHGIRQLTGPADLGQHRLAVVRALAGRLHLPWPAWLDPTDTRRPEPSPDPAPSCDATRVHAVLATLLDRTVPLDILAEILDWPLDRATAAVQDLASRIRATDGVRLANTATTVTLTITARLLDRDTTARLELIRRIDGGTDPTIYHLICRIAAGDKPRAEALARRARSALQAAAEARLITYDLSPDSYDDGTYRWPYPTNLNLTADVAYSLGLDPPDQKRRDQTTDES